MPQINIAACGHGHFIDKGEYYFPYRPEEPYLAILKQAMSHIDRVIKGMKSCNNCFKNLPKGRDFKTVWEDKTIWINYSPQTTDYWGITYGVGGTEISIPKATFEKGFKFVAGTLVHELAHTNGAPVTTMEAESTLIYCGLKDLYDKGAIGMRQSGTIG